MARKPVARVSCCDDMSETEGNLTLVVDLARSLDEILEMSASEEVTEVDEFAVPLVLYVDGAPAVLTSGDIAASRVLVQCWGKNLSLEELTRQCSWCAPSRLQRRE